MGAGKLPEWLRALNKFKEEVMELLKALQAAVATDLERAKQERIALAKAINHSANEGNKLLYAVGMIEHKLGMRAEPPPQPPADLGAPAPKPAGNGQSAPPLIATARKAVLSKCCKVQLVPRMNGAMACIKCGKEIGQIRSHGA